MSNVPTNLIPTKVTGLPEYLGSSTLGYLPYVLEGRTYKVQFANIAAVGAVPSTREINTGSGLGGGGDLSANRTLFILPGGVDDSRLTTTGVAAGTYGAADTIPVFSVNAQGRVTGVTNTSIVLSGYVPTSRIITAGAGLSGGGDLSANRTFAVNFSSTTPEPLGPGSPGVSTVAAREDHVHPAVDLSDTTETQGVLPLVRGGTGNSLSPVVGAIAYSSNDALYLTPTAGDAGQVLTSDGGAGAPYWTTISGTGTVTSVNLTAGTGISVSGGPITSSGSINVVNTAPDQIVSLTAGTNVTITGTYPSFTIAATGGGGGSGTVTSVDASGGTTGLSFTGGPITTSGTLTLGGTLAVANGGTGATTLTSGYLVKGNGTSAVSASVVYDDGTNVGIGTTTPAALLSISRNGGGDIGALVTQTNSGNGTTGRYRATHGSGAAVNLEAGNGYTAVKTTSASPLGLYTSDAERFRIASAGQWGIGGANYGTAGQVFTSGGASAAPTWTTPTTGTVTSVGGTGTVNGITLTGSVTTSGDLTLGGTLSGVNLTSQVTGTLPVANGGTGVTTSTGTGSVVLSNSPALVTPTLGAASATSLTTTGQVTVPDQLAYDYAASNLPTTRPALSLDFVNVGALDPRVTFTRSSTATVTGSNGLIQTAAINAPRFDYDPVTLAAKGLLIEEQRTNLILYSEQFNNVIWATVTLTIAANTTVSPDGTSSADTATRTTTASTENNLRVTTTQTVSTAHTFSVYVKANTAGARLYMRNLAVDNTITTGVVQFNPADGTISTTYGSVYVDKATMTAVGNGWYRCSITGTTAASIATNFIDIGVTDGTSAVGGNAANSVFIWGAQLEVGSFATSYIPTVASQVTRTVDIASMTGTNFSSWYNQTQGTLFSTILAGPASPTDTQTALYVTDATAINLINIRRNTASNVASLLQTSGGSGAGLVPISPVTSNSIYKNATAYALNNANAATNGTLATLDTAVSTPPVDRLFIGVISVGTSACNGHIRQIAYYNTRLSDVQLQALTV